MCELKNLDSNFYILQTITYVKPACVCLPSSSPTHQTDVSLWIRWRCPRSGWPARWMCSQRCRPLCWWRALRRDRKMGWGQKNKVLSISWKQLVCVFDFKAPDLWHSYRLPFRLWSEHASGALLHVRVPLKTERSWREDEESPTKTEPTGAVCGSPAESCSLTSKVSAGNGNTHWRESDNSPP